MSKDGKTISKEAQDLGYKIKAVAFLTFAGGFGLFAGFAGALATVKKSDPSGFDKGLVGQIDKAALRKVKIHESGAALASKALAFGTLWAFAGCGLLFGGIWKLSRAKTFEEFRVKCGNLLPSIPKKESVGRTEFSGINDFLQYVIDQDKEEQAAKKSATKSGSS